MQPFAAIKIEKLLNISRNRTRRPASAASLSMPKTFLPERLDCGRFVVFHIENGIQLRDLQQVVDLLGQI